MNRSFLILFIPFLSFYPLLRFAQVFPRMLKRLDVRLFTLESDFNALAVPSPQEFGGMAARTGVERVHQP